MSADSGPGTREVARRLFAAEFDDASLSYSESDEERAPNYVVTPTGARVNRLFAVGVLTEVEAVNEDSLRGRVVDPSGAFVTYAGQYQPDEHAFLSRTEPPTFVALAGKARTFEPEDSDRVFTSVRPESINEVDAATRDRWVVSAAEQTLDRIAVFAAALDSEYRGDRLRAALEAASVDASLATGVPKAIDHYGTGTAYLEAVRSLAVQAVEQVAGEREAVGSLETEPDDDSAVELGALPEVDVDLGAVEVQATDPETEESPEGTEPTDSGIEESASEEPEDVLEESEPEVETEDAGAESGSTSTDSATGAESEPEGSEASTEPAADETGQAISETESESAEAESTTGGSDDEPEEVAEPAENSESTETTDKDDLGDFDAGDAGQGTVENEAEELDDFDPEEPVDDDEALTEDERREVEEEFGTEFSTGSEVGEPGEADIDVPTSEEELEELEDEPATDDDQAATDESTADEDSAVEAESDSPADVDLEDAVVDAMADLDDGDGADRDAVIEHVVESHGADADAVEDAIEDAMMSGKCYEPSDGTLKAI
ncbi:MAG: hypothetical protein ACOCQU_04330 [Halolamina sp.]